MADVFISYSKADRPLALKLAAMLEAEGWKVWWDTGLIPGDDFRNEIMSQLGRARAVIVIWTDASIKSDWVRSEAGRAQADHKPPALPPNGRTILIYVADRTRRLKTVADCRSRSGAPSSVPIPSRPARFMIGVLPVCAASTSQRGIAIRCGGCL
jgi:hypothetical protein